MYKLIEVKEYLNDILTEERIEQCYNLITNPKLRVNTEDKKWVACEQKHELETVYEAICEILNIKYEEKENFKEPFMDVIEDTCLRFIKWEESHKPRIPFYILVLDKIIK